MYIYIDIETIPGPNKPDLDNIQAPSNYKDPDKISAYREAKQEEEWRKEALHPLKGRVLCIGWAVDDQPVQATLMADERVLVSAWTRALPDFKNNAVSWVGHNSQSFDMLWLRLRALRYGLPIANRINLNRYNGNVVDTMLEIGGGYGKFYSLADACAFFGIHCKTNGMDGSQVFDYWQAGRLDEIADYCKQDVEAVRALYNKLQGK